MSFAIIDLNRYDQAPRASIKAKGTHPYRVRSLPNFSALKIGRFVQREASVTQ
jgi:hypothetical protein